MASDIGKLVGYAALAYGAYWLYENYFATPAVAAAPPASPATPQANQSTSVVSANTPAGTTVASGGNTTAQVNATPSGSGSSAAPVVTANQLYSAANLGNGSGASADDWSYYYAHITGVSIPPSVFDGLFGPVGSASRTQWYSAEDFLSKIASAGFHGLGLIGSYNPYTLYGAPGIHGLRGMGGPVIAGRMERSVERYLS